MVASLLHVPQKKIFIIAHVSLAAAISRKAVSETRRGRGMKKAAVSSATVDGSSSRGEKESASTMNARWFTHQIPRGAGSASRALESWPRSAG